MTENEWLTKVKAAATKAETTRVARDKVLIEAYAEGHVSAAKIAKAVGMTVGRVFQIVQAAGKSRGAKRA